MRIYAVDDERFMLEALVGALREVSPQSDIKGFSNSLDLLTCMQKTPCDIAFLDVQMPDMSGIDLARQLLQIKPDTNIVFVTAFDKYKADAMDLRASDYVTKPFTADAIREAMDNLRHPIPESAERFRALTFGNFALYVDREPVRFHRKRRYEQNIERAPSACRLKLNNPWVGADNARYPSKARPARLPHT